MAERIGVFGGTFDPPHLGHLILASEARAQLRLDRLLWVLTAAPPHKLGQAISALEDRLAMLKLALNGEKGFEISRVDIDRPGPHYTTDTLQLLRQQNPGATLVFLIGEDSLRDMSTWHEPALVVAECDEIGVMQRPGVKTDLTRLELQIPGISSKVRPVHAPLLEIASNEIRRRVAEGRPFRYFVPEEVYRYIEEKELYRGRTENRES
jgi:nicotinate-nucleotide adenylyltransferase